jgi:lysophospholipase L1-like esterase
MLAGIGFSLCGQNLLNNPGFENSSSWTTPEYWAGELKIISPGLKGKSCGELKATQQGKKFYGRTYQLIRAESLWGSRFAYSMQAKGTGELYLGFLKYTTNEQGKTVSQYVYSTPLTLKSDEWQEISMTIQPMETNVVRIAPFVEVRGENSVAYLDEGNLVVDRTPGVLLTAIPAHPIIAEGKARPEVAFLLTENGKPVADAGLQVRIGDKIQAGISGKDGRFVIQPGEDGANITVAAEKYGVVEGLFMDRISPEAWSKFDAAARKVKLEKPVSILYLGDSLSDFGRGQNYADKLNFWLNLYNPGKATFRNAGVRGDYITRTRDRMIRGRAFMQERFDNLFDTPYDYIFIFLGHNDTRSRSNENYAKPQISPDVQKAAYKEVINHIRKHSNARIVLVSPTSSNFEQCSKQAEKATEQKKVHSRFGEPAMLEAFDATLRELAKEENLGYLDVYTPTRDLPGKAALFSPVDGVHLTEDGNRFLSGLFLDFFAK